MMTSGLPSTYDYALIPYTILHGEVRPTLTLTSITTYATVIFNSAAVYDLK